MIWKEKLPLSRRILLGVGIGILVFGWVHISSSMAQPKPIKIGFSMGLSGSLASAGKAAVLAMKIWAEDINARGGLLGRPVELVYYDDHSKPADVPAIYTKLITVDKVDFVVSPYGTPLIAAAMPIVMEHQMVFPCLLGLGSNQAFNYKYHFEIMPSGPDPYVDWSEGFFAIASRQEPKPQTIAFLHVDSEYGANNLSGTKKLAEKYNFKVVYEKKYPPGTVDFTSILRSIKAVNPDMVYVASYPTESAGIVQAAKEVNLKPKIFGGGMVGLQYTSIQTNLGPTLNGIVTYWFWVPEPTLKFAGIEEFLKKYQARAGQEGVDPLGYYLPPWAYAYVELLGQAIEATQSLDQVTVGEYIRSHEFNTIVGKVKFAPNGEWEKGRVLWGQYQNIESRDISEFSKSGRMVVIYPDEYKSGELIYPFPGWQ
ncbi:MAG TPA: amino acid ABC transporter substrate-binding protein [Candidatus Limnocylindrales bacterium]|nr:amino acid ABC transporter substrate-binding protein [Candidatus Limnocylindrales bacterium]